MTIATLFRSPALGRCSRDRSMILVPPWLVPRHEVTSARSERPRIQAPSVRAGLIEGSASRVSSARGRFSLTLTGGNHYTRPHGEGVLCWRSRHPVSCGWWPRMPLAVNLGANAGCKPKTCICVFDSTTVLLQSYFVTDAHAQERDEGTNLQISASDRDRTHASSANLTRND